MDEKVETVRLFGDPVLKKHSEEVTEFDESLRELNNIMINTLYVENGMGLAAPQVGVLKKLAVIDLSFGEEVDKILTIVNPLIVSGEGETSYEEGCLSLPGIWEDVMRPEKIFLKFQDIDGNHHELEADKLLARVLQHEIDHLHGILFIDRLSSVKRNFLAKKLHEISEESGQIR